MNQINSQAAAAREGARVKSGAKSGQFGTQVRSENDGVMLTGETDYDGPAYFVIGRPLTEREEAMAAVAEHLPGYRFEPGADGLRGSMLISEKDGLELLFQKDDSYDVPKGKTKVTVYELDKHPGGHGYSGIERKTSTVTHAQDPKRIAKTLERNLLTEARPQAAKHREAIAKWNEATNNAASALADFESAAGVYADRRTNKRSGEDILFRAGDHEVKARGAGAGKVYLNIADYTSMTVDQAARIVEILKEGKNR